MQGYKRFGIFGDDWHGLMIVCLAILQKKCCCYRRRASFLIPLVMYKNSLDIDVCVSFFPGILLFACQLIGVLNLKSFNVVLMIVECWLFFGFHF